MHGVEWIEIAPDTKAFGLRDRDAVPGHGLSDCLDPTERNTGGDRYLLQRHGADVLRGKCPPCVEANQSGGMVAQQFPSRRRIHWRGFYPTKSAVNCRFLVDVGHAATFRPVRQLGRLRRPRTLSRIFRSALQAVGPENPQSPPQTKAGGFSVFTPCPFVCLRRRGKRQRRGGACARCASE